MNNATDPLPSWRVLVDALKSAPVGENKLAQELERYCSPEDRSSLGEWDPTQAKCHEDDVFRRMVVTFSGSVCCDHGNTGQFMHIYLA